MPCFHPLTGYRSRTVNSSGKRSITFNVNQGYADLSLEIPCGQCIGCRLEKSRQWAIRCVLEASLHQYSSFLTLTYAPEYLPLHGSLRVEDFQNFMKRYRKWSPRKLRFFHCGEYGEQGGRPHYHALIFGHEFQDKLPTGQKNENGDPYYVSPKLDELWGKGACLIGDLTFESAAYVARYITKKITGEKALHHYNNICLQTGEILSERKPEYVTMSRRPGIGKPWFDRYVTDVFPKDFFHVRGKKVRPPKVFNSYFELLEPEIMAEIKGRRVRAAKEHAENNTRDRLDVREEVQLAKYKLLKRNFEK